MRGIKSMSTGPRGCAGQRDILVIVLIAIVLVAALIYVLFRIISHTEEHIETVRNTRVLYDDSLRWRPDSKQSERRIRKDLKKDPFRKKAEYNDMELNEDCLKMIGRMSKLENLKLTRSTMQDQWLGYLINLPLESLGVSGTPLTDRSVPYILEMPKLQSLSIGDTDLTDQGLKLLSASRSIERLELNLGRCITNDGIRYVGNMTRLTHLELAGSRNLSGKCLSSLTNLRKLTHLNLAGLPVTAKELRLLSHLRSLTNLDLSKVDLSDESLAELARMSPLRELDLTGSRFSHRGLLSLSRLKTLSSLRIKSCPGLDGQTVEKFRLAMPDCRVNYSPASTFNEKLSRSKVRQEVEFLESEARKAMETSDEGQ